MSGEVQVWLDRDEWYPVYDYTTEAKPWRTGPFTVPRDLLERVDKATAEFCAVQDELAKVYNRGRDVTPEVAGDE